MQGMSKVRIVHGGATRQESVRLGVEALHKELREQMVETKELCVLVHDAARCCISTQVIERVVEGVARQGAVTAAVPVPDSLARVSGSEIVGTVDRDAVWAVQTPQGFLFEDLRSAHYAASVDGFVGLDDASVVARLRPVFVVEGDRLNIKVTHPSDLEVARRIMGVK
jgi:2-C-methyl-D-erythritol 4-phosphate cytidylyltransferase